jgi:hypothetical protein
MNGIDLYGHIQQDRPEIAVLFIPGKADDFRKSIPECPLFGEAVPLATIPGNSSGSVSTVENQDPPLQVAGALPV